MRLEPSAARRALAGLAGLAGLALVACTSAPLRYYVLAAPADAGPPGSAIPPARVISTPIAVAPVDIPDSIDRAEIAYRAGTNRLQFVARSRWAEPLRGALARALAAALERRGIAAAPPGSPLADSAPARLVLGLSAITPDADGAIALTGDWTLASGPASGIGPAGGRFDLRLPRVEGPSGLARPVSSARGDADALEAPSAESIAAAYLRAVEAIASQISAEIMRKR